MGDKNELIVRAAACSIGGKVRGANEDNVFFNGDYITKEMIENDYSVKTGQPQGVNLFGVFDGMGQQNRGALASNIAASKLCDTYSEIRKCDPSEVDDIVLEYINRANEAVSIASRRSNKRCGTTFSALYTNRQTAVAYNIGDSRIFLLRGNELFQVSRDHYPQDGDPFADEGFDNRVSQFLGLYENEKDLEPFRSKNITLQKGDKFLLCTDGVSDNMPRETIREILSKNKDAFSCANELCRTAESNGSQDNMSAVVITVNTKGFHPTTNMIMCAVMVGVFILGFLIGYFTGYLFGSASYGKTNLDDGGDIGPAVLVESAEPDIDDVYSELFPEESEDESSNDESSEAESKESKSSVTKIKMSKSDITLEYLQEFQLSVTFSPKGASEDIIWESSNTNAVTVDKNGVVRGVGAGKYAEITATGKESGKKATCVVRVKIPETTTTTTTTKAEEENHETDEN
ncbi:MAG: protein phosphatase 2C domain-containing protein [Clostridia bacterium]|nr:protein phosphatase 2C domain-containing protein [Clostridia bacterium]